MKTLPTLVTAVLLWGISCNHQEQPIPDLFVPKVVEANGFNVPIDSMAAPRAVPAGKPRVVRAGSFNEVPITTNVHPVKNPKVVLVGEPKVCIPGQDNFSLPKTKTSIDSPFIAGIPEIIIAKEAFSKDQNPQNFSTLGKLQGLNYLEITCMLEDRNGNLWFGTAGGGVSKYDGKSFTHFTDKEGLSNNIIWSMLEDNSGNIWFGTFGRGVTKYDGKAFTHFTEQEGLSSNYVWCMLEDKSGNLWFGTGGGGVSKFDDISFTHFTEKEGLSNNDVKSILEDKSGNLWFGTFGGGVNKYDGKSFTHFTEKEGLSNNKVQSILEDKSGNLWFGTLGGGVNKYEGKSFTHFTDKEGLSNNFVLSILIDKEGNLWFGTLGGGVNKYDGKNFTHFTDKEGLSFNDVRSILEDKSGNLWFGTMGGGVNKFKGRSFTHFTEKEGLSNNVVWSIMEDKSGNLWFGTQNGGVNKYDISAQSTGVLNQVNNNTVRKNFIHFTEKEGLSPGTVFSILEDKNGHIWFGTGGGGVSKYDGKSFTHFTEKEGLCNNWVWHILEDKNGNLWFGTSGGVSKYDGQSFTHFTEKEGLSNNIVKTILEDKEGNLWFGTLGGGISKYDGRGFIHFTEKEGLNHGSIFSMLEDKNGNLWIGTGGGGVSKFDGISFTHFTQNEGLSNNFVESIMEDKRGDLWFGTRYGLNKLEIGKLTSFTNPIAFSTADKTSSGLNESAFLFKTYTYEDGFSGIGVNAGKTIYEAMDGTIWIGAGDRLTAFHPEDETQDTTGPNIQLTGLALFNENIPWQKLGPTSIKDDGIPVQMAIGSDLDGKVKDTIMVLGNGVRVHDFHFESLSKWYGVPGHLSLPYDNNYITFQFVGITTQSPKKVKYQYKLEGLDKNWSAITERSEAPYGNLPHDRYTFKVRAMNGEGIWSSELQYPFEIRPPWWLTWWAHSLYAIMGIGLLYGLRQYTVNRERIKHALKIQKLETEKMQEVDHLKSRFFANISHEFRTPLTLILGPLEKFASQASTENPDKPIYQMMQRNAKRLLHLINQLLDLSKIETGSMKLETKPADLVSFLKSMVLSFTSLAERKQTKYYFQYPNGHPVAYFDGDKLEKIITNLLSNAFKFTPPGGKITVTAMLKPSEDKSVPAATDLGGTAAGTKILELKVQDSGSGIPADQIEKIFDRFYQIDTSHTREQEGSGIGLSLVRELVELHQGEIFVESQTDQGSCFTIRLPLLMADFKEMAISGPALSNGEKEINPLDLAEDEKVKSAEPIMEDAGPEAPWILINLSSINNWY